MASGFFALLDDIAMLLDDTAAMSKVAVKKTSAILVDDMAVNAEKSTGFHHDRELPVLWAITKGSLINKLVIVPIALLLTAFAPWILAPILIVGGIYLAYEGAEKIIEWVHGKKGDKDAKMQALIADPLKFEADKIRAAIRTDFILSIEIVLIILSTVADEPLGTRILVTSLVSLLATVGVYSLVAGIIRMDDAGLYLIKRHEQQASALRQMAARAGHAMIASMPWIVRALAIIGTVAMVLVGGGILVHNVDALHHLNETAFSFSPFLGEALAGLVAGMVAVTVHHIWGAVRARFVGGTAKAS